MISKDGLSATIATELEALLAVPSPTGLCDAVSAHVEMRLQGLGLVVRRKQDGAVWCVIEGTDREAVAIGFVAHLDTLGAQVKRLKDNGRVELIAVGTWAARFAEGARARLHSDTRQFTGTILPLKASGHTFNTEVDTQPVDWTNVEMRIDEDVTSAADLKGLGIDVGDMVSIDPQMEFLDNNYIVSRHLDDKAGAAAMLAAAAILVEPDNKPARDVHLIFTVSEETGSGASTIVDASVGDLIAVDIGTTAPGQASREHGVTIGMGDQSGPFNHALTRELIATCKANGIEHQRDVFRHYKSDLVSARQAGVDARMALIAFGVDSSHGYERIHGDALECVARLITDYSRGL